MKIESAKYMKFDPSNPELRPGIDSINAVIDGLKHGVPLDPANSHYAEIMRQVDAGELTIEPADE